MRQFDVFENPNKQAKRSAPYVVILQSDVATGPHTVIVAPLAKKSDAPANDRIVVPVDVNGASYVILFQALAAISKTGLREPIASLPHLQSAIPRAIDYLFLGM